MPKVYLELGLYTGETLRKVLPHCGQAYGVDMKRRPQLDALSKLPNCNISYQSTDSFFESFTEGIDMAFIDADHCAKSAHKDFINCLKLLRPGGAIILHDTDPAKDALIHPGYCGDSFKVVPILEAMPDLNVMTLPVQDPGLTIVTRKDETRVQRRKRQASETKFV